MVSLSPELLEKVGAVEAYPDMMPGKLFVTCPDAAKSCVSLQTCERLHTETLARKADQESCARPCATCPTGGLLWRTGATGHPSAVIDHCPRCGRTGRMVGRSKQAANTRKNMIPTPWAVSCISCWNRGREHKKGRSARGHAIVQPPLMAPWLIGHVQSGERAWSVWFGDSHSEAIERHLLNNPDTEFHDQRPGITGFDASGHPVYFCKTHRQTPLRRDWHKDAPTVGRVRFYCPDCEPKARTLPVARALRPMQFATVQETALVYAAFEGKTTTTATICQDCHRAPLRLTRDRAGVVSASCPCCNVCATSDSHDDAHHWIGPEPVQPPYFSVFHGMGYGDFPQSGSGAASLPSVPTSPLTLGCVPQLPFNRLRACILAALGEWEYLDGIALTLDTKRTGGPELLALLAQLRR